MEAVFSSSGGSGPGISPTGASWRAPSESEDFSPYNTTLEPKHRSEQLLAICGGHLQLLGQLLAADTADAAAADTAPLSRSCDALLQALGAAGLSPSQLGEALADVRGQHQPGELSPVPQRRRSTAGSATDALYDDIPDDISITLAGMSSVAVWGSHSSGHYVKHLRRFMAKTWVEFFWLFCILVNTICMMIEEQYLGALEGYRLGYYQETGSNRYPSLEAVLEASDWTFAGIFTIEIIMRLVAMGRRFWSSPSCVVDLLVVIATDVGLALRSRVNLQVLRLMRLTRLVRILRLIRSMETIETFQLMATSLRACVTSATWAIIVLCVGLTVFALLMTMIVRDFYLQEESNSNLTLEEKLELFEYFGSYSRSMVSMFELALANWPVICRFLQEDLYEGWAVAAIFYKLTVGFAMIGILNAVFMQETFSAIEIDDSIMVAKKRRADKAHSKKMLRLFKHADKDDQGFLSRSGLRRVLRSPAIRTWLSSMNLDCTDSDLLFDLIDVAGVGRITLEDLEHGVASLRGPARSIDVKALKTAWEREATSRAVSPLRPRPL